MTFVLSMDQLRAVAELARANKQVEQAKRARDAVEDRCHDMGVSDSQIGAILGYHRSHVCRRRRDRQDRAALRAVSS